MNKNIIAICLAWLIVMLPIVEAQATNGQAAETPLFVNATIPRYPRIANIDIPGTTKPGATVTITINGVDTKKDIIEGSTFLFKNVPLQPSSTIVVKAELAGETATQTYQADVDNSAPLMNITIPPVVTTATATAKVKLSEPVNLTVQAGNATPKNHTLQAGSNEVQVALTPGENMVTFIAIDKAGFRTVVEERVVYDTGPPRFETTNLDKLSPSYRQEVEVKGKLSEPGSVTAFVNGRPQKTVTTDADGSFSIKVKLERPIGSKAGQTSITGSAVSIDAGIQWKSKVRLEAIDAAGLKASTPEVEITYAICGSGTWIDVQLSEPMPEILNPRLLIEGIQQVGIAFNYTYRGGQKATIDARNIRVKPLVLAPDVRKEYDNNLIQVRAPNVRAQRAAKPQGVGYIQINFQPIDDPWELPEKDGKTEQAPANATMFEREERISNHRLGDCVPGLGCMKLFIELEIPFTETSMKMAYDPKVAGTLEKEVVEHLTQRTCIDVNIAIDRRIPPDVLPSGMLKTVSRTLGKIVEGIDKILTPIQTIGKYLFYTCVAGQFLSYVPIFLEKYNCEFKKVTDILSGGEGAFDVNVAAINACDAEYGAGSDSAENCNTCAKWKDYRKKFVRTYRQVCDRVMCPAAPSLQYYLRTRGRQTPTEVKAENAKEEFKDYLVNGKLYTGSDCAAWVLKNANDIGARETRAKRIIIPPRLFFTNTQIQGIYNDWLKHQSDTAGEGEGVNCAGLHPATPECCGYEYMQEWSSACGVSALGQGLDTFDEIKESTCLSAQQIGKNEIEGQDGEPVQCNKLLNALGGFCEKNGMPPLTPIRVTTISSNVAEDLELQKFAESQELYIIVQEKGGENALEGILTRGASQGYSIKLGIIVKTLEFQKSDKPDVLATSERSKLTEKLDVVEYPGFEDFQERNFKQEAIDKYRKTGAIPDEFAEDLSKASGSSKFDAKSLYAQVIAAIGTPDKEYIIKPNDGLVNSIRCLCFPTIIGYLKLWRNIMGAVKSCVDTILLTGDGENGVCQALVSQYVCDLLYDALACFTQKFSTGQGRIEREGGGDIMGALVAAGSEMSREVEGRYGETGMYKAVFVDRKLVHSICMWAFTGTWNLDLGAVFDQSVDDIPLNSQALLTPCNRRFVAFNPSTRPGGLVTWVYHFGAFFAAGADAEVELHLVCSDDYSCKESDGFENGRCDCQGKGKRDIVIRPENLPARAKKNQILSEEIFYTMQAGSGESNVRYDKAYLLYRWKEANKQMREDKTEPCSIGQTGGGGSLPAFCRWDPFTVSFRCSFGEAAGGIRFKEGKVEYPHNLKDKGPAYGIQENLNIGVSLQQDYPGGEQYNKYLQYTIIGPGGRELATNKDRGLILLQTNGDYTKRLAADNVPIEVKKEWFTTTEPGKPFAIRQWTNKNPSAISDNKIIDNVQLVGLAGPVTTRKQYVLELTRQADKVNYAVYTAGVSTTLGGEKGGFYVAQPALCTGTAGNRITCTPQITPAPGQAPIPQDTLTITLKPDAVLPTTDETIQLHIDLNIPRAADPCAGDVKNRPIQQFTMQLMAFDADQYGSPTDQVSIDPYTGAEAIFTIPFNAICATAKELEPLEGILGLAEILAGLRTDVTTFKQRQEKHLADVNKWLEGDIKIENSMAIQQLLSTIASTELADAAVLQTKYLKNLEGKTELQSISKAANQLYAVLGEIPQLEGILGIQVTAVFKAANVPFRANSAREEISKTTDVTAIREQLQEFRPILANAIDKKSELLALLPAAAGEKEACPDKQTDAEGNYYLCSADIFTGPWITDASKQCRTITTQTCWKLPAANYCSGTKNGDLYKCDSECTGNSFEHTGSYIYCPDGKKCCVVRETITKRLRDLRDKIENAGNQDDIFANYLSGKLAESDDQLQQSLTSRQIINDLESFIKAKELEIQGLSSLVKSYEGQNTEVPIEVKNFLERKVQTIVPPGSIIAIYGLPISVDRLNDIKYRLNAMSQRAPTGPGGPTPENIRAALSQVAFELDGIKIMRAFAVNALNKDLGLVPKKTEEVVKEAVEEQPPAPQQAITPPPQTTTCGNGAIDQGEICDKKNGDVIVIAADEWIGYNPKDYTVYWGYEGLPSDKIFFNKNLKDFCYDLVGEDCDDVIEYSVKRGVCEDNCKTFMPRVTCVDNDIFGDDGRAAYLVPEFTVKNGRREMQYVHQYLYSDPNFGDSDTKNMCYPANPMPKTPPVNTNWVN
ncbi:MAG: hypothetical protein QW165_01965 [Candidatus Woesearchaeota archaeon]